MALDSPLPQLQQRALSRVCNATHIATAEAAVLWPRFTSFLGGFEADG